MEEGKSGRKEDTEGETKKEQESGKGSEPEEVMEEDDVTEEPEMDVAVIVAALVVEAHRRKLASRAQSKEAIAEKANNVADNDKTEEELLQDSDRCEEEALATLVETEAVIEIQVAPEGGDNTTSSVLEIESETVSDDVETEIPVGSFEESNQTNEDDMERLNEVGKAHAEEEKPGKKDENLPDQESNMTQDQDHLEQQNPDKILRPELVSESSCFAEEETLTLDRTRFGEVGECPTLIVGKPVVGENEVKGEKNKVEDQDEQTEKENDKEGNKTNKSNNIPEVDGNEKEEAAASYTDDEANEKLIEEEKLAEEVENVKEIDFSSDSIITNRDSVNLNIEDCFHGIEEKRRNSLNNQNESLSDNCFEETSVQHPVISGLVLTHEQIERNFDETSEASTSNMSPAPLESPVTELTQQEKNVDTCWEADQLNQIGVCQETRGGQERDGEQEVGLIGSVELRPAPDSFVSGMTEAAYVQCTPPPSILVPSISRDQDEEDNTTFIGLEVDHEEQAEEEEGDLKGELNEEPFSSSSASERDLAEDRADKDDEERVEKKRNELQEKHNGKERGEEEEDRQGEETEDEDEALLASLARLGCEKIIMRRKSDSTLQTPLLLDDEREGRSSQTPATSCAASHQMQEDHHQPPFSYHDQSDSILVLNSSFEEEDDNEDSEFLSEDEDGLINDGRVVLENIEEEDEEDSVVDAEETFPSRASAEIVWDDRGGFSGRVVARGETEDDTEEDAETEDSTDSEGESCPVQTSRTNYVEAEWTGPTLMEDKLEPISIESVVTVIGREEDVGEQSGNTYLAEGNKMSAMEFLLFQEGSEDLEFFPNEEEMRAKEEERRGREDSRSRPTSDFRSSFESFLSSSSDGEEDTMAVENMLSRMMIEEGEEDEDVSSDEGIDENEDEKDVKNVGLETNVTGKSGEGDIQELTWSTGNTSCK